MSALEASFKFNMLLGIIKLVLGNNDDLYFIGIILIFLKVINFNLKKTSIIKLLTCVPSKEFCNINIIYGLLK